MRRSNPKLSDLERLHLYTKRVALLEEATLVSDVKSPRIKLNLIANQTLGVVSELEIPTNDPMIALATIERQFLLETEEVFFNKIANLLSKLAKDHFPEMLNELASIKKRFKVIGEEPKSLRPCFEGKYFTHDYCLDLYLYGRVIHSDPEKVKKIERIEANGFMYGFFKMIVASAILDYIDPIVDLNRIVKKYLARIEG